MDGTVGAVVGEVKPRIGVAEQAGVAALGEHGPAALARLAIGGVVELTHDPAAIQIPHRPHAAQMVPLLVQPPAAAPFALGIGIGQAAAAAAQPADAVAAPADAAEAVVAALADTPAQAVIAEPVFDLARILRLHLPST